MAPTDRESRLWAQYQNALDEYRFQVQLNWERTKYLLTLDIAAASAATGLMGIEKVNAVLVAAVFIVGTAISALGLVTINTQRSYYHAARTLKANLEQELGLDEFAIRTTPGMEPSSDRRRRRFLRVHEVQVGIFWLLFAVHVVGAVVAAR